MSPWSSKGTVQPSSPSSVDTVRLGGPHSGYTITQQCRVVTSLPRPFLVQCTLFKLEQNIPQPLLVLAVYELWMDTSSSVHIQYWATSSRAMQSSSPSFLLVSSVIIHTYINCTLWPCTVNVATTVQQVYICKWTSCCISLCILPDYQPALSFKTSAVVFPNVSLTRNFFERNFTCTYSYKKSCNRYPRCTSYFSVEHTVSPQSAVDESSSGCIVRYTFYNLTRCVSYQSTATTLLGNQRGNSVVTGVSIMLGKWLQLIHTRLQWRG